MPPILIFIIGVALGGVVAWIFLRPAHKKHSNNLPPSHKATDGQGENVGMSEKGGENLSQTQREEKAERKQKILGLLARQSSLTNNQIEELLGVSDATATRYMEELEQEGRVRQVGEKGRFVRYEKI